MVSNFMFLWALCMCFSCFDFFCFILSSNEIQKGIEWEGEDGGGEPGGETMITYIV